MFFYICIGCCWIYVILSFVRMDLIWFDSFSCFCRKNNVGNRRILVVALKFFLLSKRNVFLWVLNATELLVCILPFARQNSKHFVDLTILFISLFETWTWSQTSSLDHFYHNLARSEHFHCIEMVNINESDEKSYPL